MSFIRLPIEIISLITELLDIEDVFNIGSSCRSFQYLLRGETICRLVLQQKADFSAEAVEAHSSCAYARGLRRIAKRRNAVRQGEPFLVAIVAIAEHFIYTNGILCYTCEGEKLHILNVHRSATEELVVNVPRLLQRGMSESQGERQYSFRPLHCSRGILSCIYTRKDCQGHTLKRLVVLRIRNGELVTQRFLHSARKIFVRNSEDYLVVGTNSRMGFDGFKRWTLEKLDMRTLKWAETETVLWNLAGSYVNVDVCFEIFDDYFYCLSNKTKFQPEHGKWNSYYSVVRFPLSDITREASCSPPMRNLWRRHAAEGPVDDRWNSLQLTKDERSGKLVIFESRRECLVKNAQSQRTCYKKELNFDLDGRDPNLAHSSDIMIDALPNDESSSEGEDESDQGPDAWNSETHLETRLPENTHAGDSGTVYSIHECFIWYYNPSCETFLDLISESENLRLRVRPKGRCRPEIANEGAVKDSQSVPSKRWSEASDVYHAVTWPPEPVSPPLDDILSPRQHFKDVEWFMDERSLVYAPGLAVPGRLRPLVLMSFDPAIHLPGYPRKSISNIPTYDRDPIGQEKNEASEQETIIQGIPWAQTCLAFYIKMPKSEESPCGLDFALTS